MSPRCAPTWCATRLITAITGPAGVPDLLGRSCSSYRMERRRGQALLVDAATIEVETPTTTSADHLSRRQRQGLRGARISQRHAAVLEPEDLVGEIEVSDADVSAAYNERIATYRTPEQRKLEQLLANDEATIKRAAEMVAAGQDFTSVAAAMKDAGVERSELGPLAEGRPARRPGRYRVGTDTRAGERAGQDAVRLASAARDRDRAGTDPTVRIGEGRDQARAGLERATSQLPDFATKLDDELAAGTPLDAAAEKLGMPLLKLENIDKTGHTPAKERLGADRLTADMLTPIFAAGQGETSLLEQSQDGRYFIFRVDAIDPAHERPLAEVHDEVAAAWKAEEQKKRAHARAAEVRPQAGTPADLAPLAQNNADLRLIEIGPVMRTDDGQVQGLAAPAIQAMFATKAGEVAADVVDLPNGSAIIAVDEVLPAETNEQMVSATDDALLNSLRGELLASYEAALRQTYSVTVNQATLAQLMEQNAQ